MGVFPRFPPKGRLIKMRSMNPIHQKHSAKINGSLSSFDRIVFKGHLRQIAFGKGIEKLLARQGYLIKDFQHVAKDLSTGVDEAAKRTADLIPLAHPLPVSHAAVEIHVDAEAGRVTIEAEAAVAAGTGVEMEAMTACAVAALTLYDMVKGLERGVTIERIQLLEKNGGKQDWRLEPDA